MRNFEELTTVEMAGLTSEQAIEYSQQGKYTLEEVKSEIKNCQGIIGRING